MVLRGFFEAFPEMAGRETRSIIVMDDPILPADEYALVEFYCEDPRCDCRKALIKVLGKAGGWLANINHAFEPDGFDVLDLPQTHLDPTGPNSELSQRLLMLTREVLRDPTYAERLRRHYQLLKNRHLSWSPPWQSSTKLKRKLLRKTGRC